MVTLRRRNSKAELFQHSGTVEIRKKTNKIEKEQKTQQTTVEAKRENISQEGRIKCLVCCEWIKQDEG